MKKIINGKKYDTETAKMVDTYDNGLGTSNFNGFIESLYIKKTKEFFLAGFGGAMTKYSKSYDSNMSCGGNRIIPLTRDEALEWLESYSDCDTIETYFENIEE